MFIMSFDFGINYIGIAVGQSYTKTANPIKCIQAKNGIPINWYEIENIINLWIIKIVIIGYPIKYSKKNKNFMKNIKFFSNKLINKFDLKVFFSDETFTSCYARNYINNNFNFCHIFYNNYNIHTISAVLILERWLNLYT